MADIVSPEVRSRMMGGIRGRNTKPELFLRKSLHARGFRFRLHAHLPGKPDLVFPKFRAVLFVNGCFWHGHGCALFKWPKSNQLFWRKKIGSNIKRDADTKRMLQSCGWRYGVVWECALKGRDRLSTDEVISKCELWLRSDVKHMTLRSGKPTKLARSVRFKA